MKIIQILFSAILFAHLQACTWTDGVTISGVYENPIKGRLVKIELIKNEKLTVVDSFELDDSGSFSRIIKLAEPSFYRINFYDRDIANMVLTNEDVEVVSDEASPRGGYKITGSKDTNYIYLLTDIKKEFVQSTQSLNQRFMQARNSGDAAALVSIQHEYLTMKKAHDDRIKAEIFKMDFSIAGILSSSFLDENSAFSFLDSLAHKYTKELPNSSYTADLVQKVERMRRLAVGSAAPEIALPNPQGKVVSLSSYKGKYVLIDFWAAWCRPCRQENPNVVRLYNQYAGKGFDILGVSLDRKKEAWVNAIADDGLIWSQVSDLKYFESEAAREYNISAIPATYLIGPDGTIVAKNLRGPSLEAKLKEIFG